ncbi:deoxynucleoside kinase [Vibrio sp. SCSIO 43137]|uniref:deoxynucleoside kinase n=1 Tax=Vibrio sp. SCSIO 43137 TaxID=3021011 RepID=UPI002307F48D|nr:deoxynucleoside kinase [Vibrio sp. SCSIO 43137]WCE31254.1 deoxynucleoside kinase [Vibrio sp. SCSIO 43137]
MLEGLAMDASDETLNVIFKDTINAPASHLHVFIRDTPKHCMKRLKAEGLKKGEFNLRYLKDLDKAYREWSAIGEEIHKVLIIDRDEMSIQDMAKVIKSHLKIYGVLGDDYEAQESLKNG